MNTQYWQAGQKINAVMNSALLRSALGYIVKGGLRLPGGHLPPSSHFVPIDFVGVGVSTSDDAAVDDFVLEKLAALNLHNVRIDFSYGDEDGPVGRLLSRLLETEHRVLLHLVQPFNEAFLMKEAEQQESWRQFVTMVCDRYGDAVAAIEVCSTINRRRWAGYDNDGFFNAWNIAYNIIKARNIPLAGPNVSDFEPMYTSSLLAKMAKENTLPDIYTNNLFSERVVEPERFDHRILGFKAATKLKVNLVKKARILRKVATDFNVPSVISPAAFWTLPRIERLLVDSEQKQADYLSRYMVLLAASGGLDKVFWGPILCWREGLIDDGSGRYPELERITHYQSVIGRREDFRCRPAFTAMKQFNQLIPGSQYLGQHFSTKGLELHEFKTETQRIMVAWTRNAAAVYLGDIFQLEDIAQAHYVISGSEQEHVTEVPDYINEVPIYFIWPVDKHIALKTPKKLRFETYYAHALEGHIYHYEKDGWTGMIVADNKAQSQQLAEQLHPEALPAAEKSTTLRRARNVVWQVPSVLNKLLVAKKPSRVAIQKRLLDKFKPSKSRRSWMAAMEMARRGISTAQPIAFFEKVDDNSMLQNVFICEQVEHDFTAREALEAFSRGEQAFYGIKAEVFYQQLASFIRRIHNRGIYFRDLAGGNILIKKAANDELSFTLIDINRARFFPMSTPLKYRLSDLTRICNKLHWPGRDILVTDYLQSLAEPKQFTAKFRRPFHLYDFKVNMKRRYGRRAIKRLWQRLSGKTP